MENACCGDNTIWKALSHIKPAPGDDEDAFMFCATGSCFYCPANILSLDILFRELFSPFIENC